jgi:creatinine amidohydrolase
VTRLWTEFRAPEFSGLGPETIAILPVGSAEQHGPHLPLNTDFVVADSLARDVVAGRGDELNLLLLPSLAVSKSNEHAWSPGTLWLSAATLLAVLDDIARSVATTPVRKLVFLNGHGGNSALLQVASRDVRLAHGLATFVMHPSVPPDQGGTSGRAGSDTDELGMGIHAGLDETSVMLYLRPDLVRLDLGERSVPEHLASFERVRFGGPVSFGWLSNDFGTDGSLGDPTGATAEYGKRKYEAMIITAAQSLAEIARFDPRPPGRRG